MKASLARARDAYFAAMDVLEIHNGLAEIFAVIRDANRYLEEKAPWSLVKSAGGKEQAAAVLFDVAEVLRNAGLLLYPFIPAKAQEIWTRLGIADEMAAADFDATLGWRASWRGLAAEIGELKSLFPRIEKTEKTGTRPILKEAGMKPDEPGAAPAGEAAVVDIAEFKRFDLRVAHVKCASAVPDAKKLLKLYIDIGGEERQIVAGIAEHYKPEDLTGKNIVVIANLKPARIRGIDSNGMLLAATDGGSVIVLVPDKPAAPGSKIS
jgi:methionyl-tRNA synthetase